VAPKHGRHFDEDSDNSCTHSAQEEIIEKPLLAPNEFELTAKHPEHEHVDQQVPQPAVQKEIGDGLP